MARDRRTRQHPVSRPASRGVAVLAWRRLRTIAALAAASLASASLASPPALAQLDGDGAAGGDLAGEDPADVPAGDCMSAPHAECPERCPSFQTCFVSGDAASLHYLVDDLRFDCDELDCLEAARRLADYCCERGEFEPSSGGGGCHLASPRSGPLSPLALAAAAVMASLLIRRRRSRSPRRSW